MPRLEVELVPATCWYSNVRTNVSRADWEKCKAYVRRKSGDRCEICGGRGYRWPVECHEIWDYDELEQVQALVGLIALCPACHEAKHIGRAHAVGNHLRAYEHLKRVNGWTDEQLMFHLEVSEALWELRSSFTWELDLTFLELLGIDSQVSDRPNGSTPNAS